MNDFENEILDNNNLEKETLNSLINHIEQDKQGGLNFSDPFTLTILNMNKEIS